MEPFVLAAFDNNVLHDVSSRPLVMANFRLVRQLDLKKKEVRRLEKTLKHKNQQLVALRKYIEYMKKDNPTTNDEAANILVDFGNMKVDEEPFDYDYLPLEEGIYSYSNE
ncbi:uncharacterized protein LOC132927494 isoform X2 [Rhopalosiphum padi]|uniref:uncharacterized protein LOC132927494 isoform X2 n=1 Tax=Rhopalosiphum padi TaxID=40932 RepID=UPI00298E45F4|nr:uncharacterized protein LOC132927494 isoform X2 [Rhopalosiphum padi]XP_060848017.1 uncharacterized protein LOC132927494 isoform X2 [Rhopalosiphum padi]XP_060848018.1 uncharacterized protein LOC132927494 isoform X2 [Rhopalosiphum padi]